MAGCLLVSSIPLDIGGHGCLTIVPAAAEGQHKTASQVPLQCTTPALQDTKISLKQLNAIQFYLA